MDNVHLKTLKKKINETYNQPVPARNTKLVITEKQNPNFGHINILLTV